MKKSAAFVIVPMIMLAFSFFLPVEKAVGETIELKFAHAYSPKHPQQTMVFEPWAEKINKLTNGKVKVTFFPGGALGKAPDSYDLAKNGVADITYVLQDYNPGRFPMTSVIQLPFMITSAEQGSRAMWKLYEKFPEFQNEYKDVKLLWLFCHGPADIFTTKKPVKALADLEGLKIRSGVAVINKALQKMGATPVTIPIPEVYSAMERGVVDGTVLPWDGVTVFKLEDLLKYATPVNLYTMAMGIVMNKKKFDSLPDDVKKVIEENSGESMSAASGKAYDEIYLPAKKQCQDKGMQVVELSAADKKKLEELAVPVREEWVSEMAARGLPGKALMDGATQLLNEKK
jgi:TRAP-type C4-dicarboxylate transport system substrate-binding protein